MMLVLKALALAMTAGVFALTLEKGAPGVSLLLGIAAMVLILLLSMEVLSPAIHYFQDLCLALGVTGLYVSPLLKCLTIAIVTNLGVSLCKDAKQNGAASALETAGTAAALCAALPLLEAFLSMLEDLV